jgi:peptidoglycan/LPS O-acetylase OafA/YrhL
VKKQYELIQAIRGIAAVLVVYFHTGHAPKFGAFGVDIFFVLSGAVMAMLMAQGPSAGAFLGRRLARIVPLYFLATTAAYLVSWLMPAARTSGNIPSFVDYLKSIAFMPHEALNGEIVPVLGVGWTLNYEMAFYLCCAAACAISIRHRAIWTTLLVALLALGSNYFFGSHSAGRFYSNPIILEFVAGLAVWHVFSGLQRKYVGAWALFLIPCFITFMAWAEWANVSIFTESGEWSRPIRYLLPAVLIVGLALFAEPVYGCVWHGIRRILLLIGDASYAIYLTHVFVIGAAAVLFAKFGLPGTSSISGSLIVILTSILVGISTHYLVERPMQSIYRRIS